MSTILQYHGGEQNGMQGTIGATLAPRPRAVAETGLTRGFLCDLVAKHLFEAGVATIRTLADRTALAGAVVEEIVNHLRREACVEVRAQVSEEQGLRFSLTDRGRGTALAALTASGYVGPAPVSHVAHAAVVRAQSVRSRPITRESMHAAFSGTTLDTTILDRLGPAVNSGRAIFIYGEPGTGKSYLAQCLGRLFDDAVLIPHAISIGETVIRIFDPAVHERLDDSGTSLMLEHGHDPRYVLCRRPTVITGGELTADMLEVQYDPAARQYRAPLQVKANGGLLILDDLGRQRAAPAEILNRWIVPMEEQVDHFSLATGEHFSLPFNVVLVFSTNLSPDELADEAFLRRIGYKIRLQALSPQQYHRIWQRVCEDCALPYDPVVCQNVIDTLHRPAAIDLLPCHPRDLIRMAVDRMTYLGLPGQLRSETLRWAWENYFIRIDRAATAGVHNSTSWE